MIVRLNNPESAAKFFEGNEETLILSALQSVMGEVYADDSEEPESAAVRLGDFIFLGGKVNDELIRGNAIFAESRFAILVPQSEEWTKKIKEIYGKAAEKHIRYAIKKDTVFDTEKLKSYTEKLPEGYQILPIDEKLYEKCKENSWSRDFISNFSSYEDYKNRGLGVMVLKDGTAVGGASSYSVFNGGIEIEIDTVESERGKGIATASGAALILLALEKNLYPSWDAANMISVRLAERLGYEFSHEYEAYFVNDFGGRFTYKFADINDVELLTETRIEVLRAANKLDETVDMTEVRVESEKYYKKAFEEDSHTAVLVFDGAKFIGAGAVSYFSVMPTYHNPSGKKAYIMNMYTKPEYRRNGIAKKTLSLLVNDAKKRGIAAISLEATDMGRPLYENFGFIKMNDEMEYKEKE